jgi:predicted nucleic acid-binding protein
MRCLLDTNAVIALLRGEAILLDMCREADWIGVSIITWLEFMALAGLTEDDERLFGALLERVDVVGLDHADVEQLNAIIQLRRETGIKLPDAIIAGCARKCDAVLVTADKQLLNVPSVESVNYAQ